MTDDAASQAARQAARLAELEQRLQEQEARIGQLTSELAVTRQELADSQRQFEQVALHLQDSLACERHTNELLSQEIEARKAAKAAVMESEARLRQLIEHMPVLIHAHGEDMRYVYWNRESERVTGYPRERILNDPDAASLLYPEQGLHHQKFTDLLCGTNYLDLQVPIRCADGSTRIISWSNVSNTTTLPGWQQWELGVDVTRQVQALEQLQKSELRTRHILEISPEAILLHQDGVIEYANPAALALFRCESLAELRRFTLPELLQGAENCAWRHGSCWETCQTSGGAVVELLSSPMPHDQSDMPLTLTMLRDITERQAHERELVESRNIIRALIDSTDDFFILMDTRYSIEACNLSWAGQFSLHPRDIVGRNVLSLLPSALRKTFRTHVAEIVARNMPLFMHLEYQGRSFNCRIYPLHNGQEVTRIAVYATDMTRMQEAARTRQELEQRYKTVFDNAGDAIFILDGNGAFLAVNAVACSLLGYSKNEFATLPLEDVAPGNSLWQYIQQAASQECPPSVQLDLRHRHGATVPLDINARAITYMNRPALLCIGRDITRWRAAETLLTQAKEAAEVAVRLQNEFVANISHELRTPLASILGLTELLLSGPQDIKSQAHIRRIASSADLLLGLINDLLDISKLESGLFSLEQRSFNLLDLVHEIKDMLVAQASKKGLDFSYAIDNALPDHFVGDPLRLRQALLNVVGNAIKFTRQGSVHIHAGPYTGGTPAPGEYLIHFTISDTGIGIQERDLCRIFDRFVQVNGAQSRQHGGAGLGLSISRKLIECMGGSIWADSTPGRGTDFHFYVRLRACPASSNATAPSPANTKSPPCSVLLVEDNDVNRDVIKAMLELDGHAVRTAVDGLHALELLRASIPDIILLDLQMPELDGFETARRIRALAGTAGSVPILALSAHAQASHAEHCLQVGMDGYLSKPVRVDELRRALLMLVHARPSRTRLAGGVGRLAQPGGVPRLERAEPEPQRERQEEPTGESPVFDPQAFSRNMNDDPTLMTLTCAKYLQHASRCLDELEAALARQDALETRRLAHSFKSIAGTVGATQARELAHSLELAAFKAAGTDAAPLPVPWTELAACAESLRKAAADAAQRLQAFCRPMQQTD
ncbi:PAS domain-containing hybrid sensor histidine kinase/response regulator [Megalodesulfovibrio paquesii]